MTTFPQVSGVIDRRILVNYRVHPAIAAEQLPPPFRPLLVHGWAIAGICLIRLRKLRPWFLPPALGLASENAAHRFAIEWEDRGVTRTGVYIPRRDTSSRFNAWAGGRLFPGLHHLARFAGRETESHWSVQVATHDGAADVAVDCERSAGVPAGSVFRDVDAASRFFQDGARGYSPTRSGCLEGLELRTSQWTLEPLLVHSAQSAFFENRELFPAGSVELDSAFVMRNIPHRWVAVPWRQDGAEVCHCADPAAETLENPPCCVPVGAPF